MLRQYVPPRLRDNPSMAGDDPGYTSKLEGPRSPELVRAMRDGEGNFVAGAYFPEFRAKHVIRQIAKPTAFQGPIRPPYHGGKYKTGANHLREAIYFVVVSAICLRCLNELDCAPRSLDVIHPLKNPASGAG